MEESGPSDLNKILRPVRASSIYGRGKWGKTGSPPPSQRLFGGSLKESLKKEAGATASDFAGGRYTADTPREGG